jgi:hypothetical protein
MTRSGQAPGGVVQHLIGDFVPSISPKLHMAGLSSLRLDLGLDRLVLRGLGLDVCI